MDAIAPPAVPKARALAGRVLAQLAPPPLMSLAQWAEANVVLPAGEPRPGKFRNWPYMREILDAIGDPEVEQVSFMKSARIGYTTALVVGIAAKLATDPCPIGLMVPTEDDARGMSLKHIMPVFSVTPAVQALERGENSSMTRKEFYGGGSLTILAAKAPRNLRRHGFKIVYGDEVDAMDVTSEGDPLSLVEKRTLAYPDRKLVWGSTPNEEDISVIERKYKSSDQRVFECCCPSCGEYFELLWRHIKFDQATVADTEQAWVECPANGCVIDERQKPKMVNAGRWRATRPEVKRHRGYRLNALVSMLAQASWGKLAAEFLAANRGGPSTLQVFVNTILAETWRVSLNRLNAEDLMARVERFGLDDIPPWVLLMTVGADVQDDRIEATVLGWGETGSPCVLAHHIIDGNTLERETWVAFDKWLMRPYRHPHGWDIFIDACAVDSGGHEGRTQVVYDFCGTRYRRRIFAIKAAGGPRGIWTRAQKTKKNSRLYIIGHDQAKTEVMERLAMEPFDAEGRLDPHAIRIGDEMNDEWFEGVTAETRRIKYVHNRPVIEFMPKREGIRNEPLDCLCYGWAVRFSPSVKAIDLAARAALRRDEDGKLNRPKRRGARDWAAALNG